MPPSHTPNPKFPRNFTRIVTEFYDFDRLFLGVSDGRRYLLTLFMARGVI